LSEYLLVALAVVPLQYGLAAVNCRKHWFTAGEIRFWGVAVFLAAELAYLGAS